MHSYLYYVWNVCTIHACMIDPLGGSDHSEQSAKQQNSIEFDNITILISSNLFHECKHDSYIIIHEC